MKLKSFHSAHLTGAAEEWNSRALWLGKFVNSTALKDLPHFVFSISQLCDNGTEDRYYPITYQSGPSTPQLSSTSVLNYLREEDNVKILISLKLHSED